MDLKKMVKDPHYLALSLYVILSIIFGFIYSNFLVIFLGWNLILAGFVYFLSDYFIMLRKKNKKTWILSLVYIVYFLFFPNTIYVMTDFVHLQNYTFFNEYASIYAYQLSDWVVLMMITLGALLGAKLGISSLKNMRFYLFGWMKRYYYLYLLGLFFISSVGIYIGRFIRLNSWEFHKILEVIPEVFHRFDFFIGFLFIYVMIHFTSYFVMSSFNKYSYNEIE
jgi:uncharacterized membrane protein